MARQQRTRAPKTKFAESHVFTCADCGYKVNTLHTIIRRGRPVTVCAAGGCSPKNREKS